MPRLLLLQTVAEATLALFIYALQTEIVAYYAMFIITPAQQYTETLFYMFTWQLLLRYVIG